MAEFSLKPIIIFFVVIILGVTFLNSIEDSVAETDDIVSLPNNESLTWPGNNTLISLANNDAVLGSETVYNQSHKLTADTDYTFTKSTIAFHNVTDRDFCTATGCLNISYDHEGDNFVADSTSRVFLRLLGLFFVFVIVAFGIQSLRESSNDLSFGFGKS